MKIVYATDLHGDKAKYRRLLELARATGATAVVNGGDMLTMEDDLHRTQRDFIEDFLDPLFAEYEKAGIYHIGYLGNDDLRIHDPCFEKACSKYPHAINLAQRKYDLGPFEFIGMNWVADYPFQLKDRCRKDREDYVFQKQLGLGVLSTEKGFEELADWPAYAAKLPTIEQELAALPKPKDASKAIYVIHMPPARIDLDICQSGDEVGSVAIYKFIEQTQPLLTLHGHIHESPKRGGHWKAQMGRTVCVQPGQPRSGALSYALIDLAAMEIDRFEVSTLSPMSTER
ncbi:MAG TPA: phosphoesterase [Elusimicrobia bacterium]|nr:phosphoesterase [Elusimicrobiota bacterium]HBT60549.1 phosphoesterase [Elusimicrobiota bacterium]